MNLKYLEGFQPLAFKSPRETEYGPSPSPQSTIYHSSSGGRGASKEDQGVFSGKERKPRERIVLETNNWDQTPGLPSSQTHADLPAENISTSN